LRSRYAVSSMPPTSTRPSDERSSPLPDSSSGGSVGLMATWCWPFAPGGRRKRRWRRRRHPAAGGLDEFRGLRVLTEAPAPHRAEPAVSAATGQRRDRGESHVLGAGTELPPAPRPWVTRRRVTSANLLCRQSQRRRSATRMRPMRPRRGVDHDLRRTPPEKIGPTSERRNYLSGASRRSPHPARRRPRSP
jgi:hypothetical protein